MPAIDRIKKLELECGEGVQHANNVAKLVKLLDDYTPDESRFEAIRALGGVLQNYAETGVLKPAKGAAQSQIQVAAWLKGRLEAFEDALLRILAHAREPALQVQSWKFLLLALTLESAIGQGVDDPAVFFANDLLQRIVDALLEAIRHAETWTDAIHEAVAGALCAFDDLKAFFYKDLAAALGKSTVQRRISRSSATAARLFALLDAISPIPAAVPRLGDLALLVPATHKRASSPLASVQTHQRYFSKAWLAFLQLPLPPQVHARILAGAHQRLIPHMLRPVLLCDYFTDSFGQGGLAALLALHGLWTLMREHELEYPAFYAQLYSLFTPNTMRSQHRSRFLRLCDLFLRSTHIPAYVTAAFAKRMARLALVAPPAGTVALLALLYNLFQRYPAILPLIHRSDDDPVVAPAYRFESDPYDMAAPLGEDTGALESSLWELGALERHYHPMVCRLVKMFSERLTQQEVPLEDYLDLHYASLTRQVLDGAAVSS